MLIDGEKWACEACVRGHRVSSCRHHDRPLIRINKKGRPFSVCIICRGPCNHREEHSKLNRDKKSDGESDSKSSKKPSTRRRIPPSSFARIAPHPAPLPSSSEPETTSQSRPRSRNSPSNRKRSSPPLPRTSSSPVIPTTATINTTTAATVTEAPIDTIATSNGYIPIISSAPVTPPLDPALLSSTNNGFPPYLDPIGPLDNSVSHLNFPYVTLPMMDESLLPTSSSPSNHTFPNDVMFAADHGYVPESMYTGFEDMDTLPEDWSTFFWNEPS